MIAPIDIANAPIDDTVVDEGDHIHILLHYAIRLIEAHILRQDTVVQRQEASAIHTSIVHCRRVMWIALKET